MKRMPGIWLIIILLYSCENLFHPEETFLTRIDNYTELEEAAGGVYGRLLQVVYPTDAYGRGGLYHPNVKGDDITRGSSSYSFYYFPGDCSLDEEPNDPFEEYYIEESQILWKNLYMVILSANNILDQFPDPAPYDQNYRYLLGEIYLIRAYCHFRLCRCFGRIPVILNNEVTFATPLPEYDEIYTCIVNDLKLANQLLPVRSSKARIPYLTPHQGSAKAVLAEVYLSWAGYPANKTEMYRQAASVAGNLIDSAQYHEMALLEDFKNVWKNDAFMNEEIVFSVSFADPVVIPEWDYINHFSTSYLSNVSYRTPPYYSAPDVPGFLGSNYACEIQFFNSYPKSYRKDLTFLTQIYVPDSLYSENTDTGYIHIDTWNACGRPFIRKLFLDTVSFPGETFERWWLDERIVFGNPRVYLLRYAQTLLTYAEARARTGDPDASAYEAVNQIRRRAHHADLYTPGSYDLTPGLTPEQFADSVVWERAWELAGEPEGRWFDLVRLKRVEKLPVLRHENEGDVPVYPITIDDYFFPIPEDDLILNPYLNQ